MHFKCIEISGFKSFVEPTKIIFGTGLTGIVGPNGCGKSNISDAIRWVLGEQRPKVLRGAKMEDFIFSGTATRKPTGMAEVSITISDIAGMIKKPELAEFNEVTVTRRLFRSGESEYLINKAACRLKDVIDLFLDTGISTRAFSIIEQDQVQRIVTSKPEDRRFIIEEAAGIMKFKHQRHEAMNKLENSQTNLSRVSDIISELERQRNSLKRQASKAERYKTFKAEANQLTLATSADDWRNLKSLEVTLSAEIIRLEEARASLETDVTARRNNQSTVQASINELSGTIAGLKEEEYQLGAAIERNQSKINVFTHQIDESVRTVERLGGEAAEIDRQMDELRTGIVQKKEEAVKVNESLAEKQSTMEEKKRGVRLIQEEINKISGEISFSERESAGTLERISRTSAALASHQTRTELLGKRAGRIAQEATEAEQAVAELRAKREEMAELLSRAEALCVRRQAELAGLNGQRTTLLAEKKGLDEKITAARTALTQTNARLESLKEVDAANEGYQEGIRSLLRLKKEQDPVASRMLGPLADRIKADPRIESALETVMGERLQALLIGETADAVAAIELLRNGKMGRGTFVSLSAGGQMAGTPDLSGIDGVIGFAADLVQCDSDVRPLAQRLLAGIVFVADVGAAMRVYERTGLAGVTLQGDMVDRTGIISGGSSAGAAAGILERKRTITELAETGAEQEKTVAYLSTELERISTSIINVESSVSEIAKSLKEEELSVVHRRKDAESIDSEVRRLEMRLETFRTETESINLEKESLAAEVSAVEKESGELKKQREDLENEIAQARENQNAARGSLAKVQEEAAAAEVGLESLKGEMNMASADIARLETSLAAAVRRVAAIKNESEGAFRHKRELENGISQLKEEIHSSLEKRHNITGQVHRVSEQLAVERTRAEALEADIRNASAGLDQARESLNEARLRSSETALRLQNLQDRAVEYGISMDDVASFDTSGLDIDECARRLTELREQLAKIGDVNMEAIEEHRQVDERLTFLTAQRDDLLASIEDLRKVIDKINRTTKTLFEETFVEVRNNFQELFKRLFNGGEADMVLTDEGNTLESGIEIIARPPGKKRQPLTLLSMGEKSMTAVAVLFSVFKVKPSPFCLLDEVDAPLDDANIGRFKSVLKEFTERTQFLIITHNQKTMAFADRLYGITMQDAGVSKILSVDLVDTDDSSRDRLKVVHG